MGSTEGPNCRALKEATPQRKKLIIKLDGSQPLEQEEYDEKRTKYLNSPGCKVIRFWNNDVMKCLDGVVLAILYVLEDDKSRGGA